MGATRNIRSRGSAYGFAVLLAGLTVAIWSTPSAQSADAGRQSFVSRCASCHGTDGNGGELGPAIAARVALRTDDELRTTLRNGFPAAGMPPFPTMADTEATDLLEHIGDAIAALLNRGQPEQAG